MHPAVFIVALIVGAAALALWTDVRFPKLAPSSITARLVNAGVATLALVLIPFPAEAGVLLFFAVMGLFLPVLGYAFLTGLWLLRCLHGALLRS
jgi:hypothetical protein